MSLGQRGWVRKCRLRDEKLGRWSIITTRKSSIRRGGKKTTNPTLGCKKGGTRIWNSPRDGGTARRGDFQQVFKRRSFKEGRSKSPTTRPKRNKLRGAKRTRRNSKARDKTKAQDTPM